MHYVAGTLITALILAVAPVAPVAPVGSGAPAGRPADRADPEDLEDAVLRELPAPDHPGDVAGTQVTVRREDPGGWAFGTAVRLAPAREGAYPDGWLWVARDHGDGWQVATEGSPAFASLSRQAPVLAQGERSLLGALDGAHPEPEAHQEQAADYRTGMRLPYAVGQQWRYTGGPHQMSGSAWSSVDFAGGDGRVRAVRDGRAYVMCGSGTGWLRVVHDRGFATDYYHLRGSISADGRAVDEGDFLGHIGTDVSCGGSATGPHVHFSLRRHGAYVAIDRYAFGKWSLRNGSQPYQGYARHGSTRVDVGGSLHNYGALGFTEGVVDTDGGGVLNQRAGPGTDHEIVGTVADGETVRVRCSARGTTHTGRGGYTSDLWNQLEERAGEAGGSSWVSDVYLWTGTGDPVAGRCAAGH